MLKYFIKCFNFKIDKVLNDEFEGHCYENAHLPEIGFKGIIFALCIEVLNEY